MHKCNEHNCTDVDSICEEISIFYGYPMRHCWFELLKFVDQETMFADHKMVTHKQISDHFRNLGWHDEKIKHVVDKVVVDYFLLYDRDNDEYCVADQIKSPF